MKRKRGSQDNKNNKGQVTLFIIIAIVIVALALMLVLVLPKITKPRIVAEVTDPEAYIGECINDQLEPFVETLASQGGYLELENCIFYHDVCRHYLCYINIPYSPCVNQQPLLKEHVEGLLTDELRSHNNKNIVSDCINNFAEVARKQGWGVVTCIDTGDDPDFNITLTENKVNTFIECAITMNKGEQINRFEKFSPFLKWPLHEFVMLAKEIIDDEITHTDFDQIGYMLRHYKFEVEKYRTSDGSKIYTLRERATGREFIFAIRNYVLPPGIL